MVSYYQELVCNQVMIIEHIKHTRLPVLGDNNFEYWFLLRSITGALAKWSATCWG